MTCSINGVKMVTNLEGAKEPSYKTAGASVHSSDQCDQQRSKTSILHNRQHKPYANVITQGSLSLYVKLVLAHQTRSRLGTTFHKFFKFQPLAILYYLSPLLQK